MKLIQFVMNKSEGIAIDTGCHHEIRQQAAIMTFCDVIVSTDCFALQLAVAGKNNVIGIFGPTPAQEIAIFDRGLKVVSEMDCSPCYIRHSSECPYNVACMKSITPEMVAEKTIGVILKVCSKK